MFSLLAFLVYGVAIAIPVYLLYFFHPQAWYWHGIALVAALALGFAPPPPQWQGQLFDLAFGFVLVNLLCWGLGGFILLMLPGRARHA